MAISEAITGKNTGKTDHNGLGRQKIPASLRVQHPESGVQFTFQAAFQLLA